MRIIVWNIRAGGGQRATEIVAQLRRWRPTVVALSEFRATPPSQAIAAALCDLGLTYQLTTAQAKQPAQNALLLASRHPLQLLSHPRQPKETERWLLARVQAPCPFTLGVMHVPNFVTGRKAAFLNAILSIARRWSFGTGLLIGDTNSGMPVLDEETPVFTRLEQGWLESLAQHGWVDAFRQRHGNRRAYTWYSPNGGNGFRLDQAFLNASLLPQLKQVRYVWGQSRIQPERQAALSDHAALLLDLIV
jgi:exonuclease III